MRWPGKQGGSQFPTPHTAPHFYTRAKLQVRQSDTGADEKAGKPARCPRRARRRPLQRHCSGDSFWLGGGPVTAPPCLAPTSGGRLPARLLAPCQAPSHLPAHVKGRALGSRNISHSGEHKPQAAAGRQAAAACGLWALALVGTEHPGVAFADRQLPMSQQTYQQACTDSTPKACCHHNIFMPILATFASMSCMRNTVMSCAQPQHHTIDSTVHCAAPKGHPPHAERSCPCPSQAAAHTKNLLSRGRSHGREASLLERVGPLQRWLAHARPARALARPGAVRCGTRQAASGQDCRDTVLHGPLHTATVQVLKMRAGLRTLGVRRCAAERRRHKLRWRIVVLELVDLRHAARPHTSQLLEMIVAKRQLHKLASLSSRVLHHSE